MWKEVLTSSAAEWVFGIAGTAILIAIAYYVIGRIRGVIYEEEIPTQEENLVDFDRMRQEGHLERDEFIDVKKTLAPKIVQKNREDGRRTEREA